MALDKDIFACSSQFQHIFDEKAFTMIFAEFVKEIFGLYFKYN